MSITKPALVPTHTSKVNFMQSTQSKNPQQYRGKKKNKIKKNPSKQGTHETQNPNAKANK